MLRNTADCPRDNGTTAAGGVFCRRETDTVSCWPTTAAGEIAVVACPFEIDGVRIDTTQNATRLCLLNGTWEHRSDYSNCRVIESTDKDNFISRLIYFVGFSTSIIALLIALFIFTYFRSLRCLRNAIHCHLIVAFILKFLLWLILYSFLSYGVNIIPWLCKGIVALLNYLTLATFFWMFVEGLYLHTIIVCAFSASRLRLLYYVVVGWVAPVVFIIAWSSMKATMEDNVCWLPVSGSYVDYIYIAPILGVLLVNMIFLGTIVYVLVTKLRESNSVQNVQYRKAVKATVVLLPLLGVIYVIFLVNPSDHEISEHIFAYFNNVLQSSQGLLVAIFYCFLNGEVKAAVSARASSWKESRQPRWPVAITDTFLRAPSSSPPTRTCTMRPRPPASQ